MYSCKSLCTVSLKSAAGPSLVVHTGNPSYLEGGGRRIMSLRSPSGNLVEPSLQIKLKVWGCSSVLEPLPSMPEPELNLYGRCVCVVVHCCRSITTDYRLTHNSQLSPHLFPICLLFAFLIPLFSSHNRFREIMCRKHRWNQIIFVQTPSSLPWD